MEQNNNGRKGGILMRINYEIYDMMRNTRPFNQMYIGMSDRNCIKDRINKLKCYRDNGELSQTQMNHCYWEILRLEMKLKSMDDTSARRRNGETEPEERWVNIEDVSPLDQGILIEAQRKNYEGTLSDKRFKRIIDKLV